MDKNSAARLIQEVFQNSFNRDRFVTFTKNLFNFLDTEKNFVYRGNFIPDAYKPYINTLERIGKYEDAEDNKIDVLIVHLKKEHSIEYARTMQRNFIAWYLGGSRGGELKDAALVAFYTDNPDDWRFSLVKMDYQIVESSTGKIKTKTELTPARRFSFLVGKNENSHTAQRQLLPILQDDKNNPLLSDLEKAFNIEVVTQEFFEKYKSLFLDVKDSLERLMQKDPTIAKDFAEKGVDPVDFSKKLLGQIVFLYFLQKKGWFGVERDSNWGTGPKNFLRLLFEKMLADYKNFFNEILEPLFYEALAKERDDDFYSRFNCKIPFLNGGLFDPLSDYDWVHTDILLPDELFSNQLKTKEGDLGTGILDIFDRYNFTVKEDEPLEKEVAVDPEMLGKVFENLLEVKDRKSKGTYYTPREIVHYMCQESLINYLVNECEGKVGREDIETLIQYGETAVEHDSRVEQEGKETETYSYKLPESIRKNAQLLDDKLKNIRVCDPAIGSGAFPVGMMNEIIRTRNTLTNYLEDKEDRSIYNFKRNAIQNSLYGVDIDPGAVEIAKLRLWLSLVVDEQDIKQIKPLPNLDYKIMQGDSLLEEFEGVKLFDEELISKPAIDDDKYRDGIKELMARLQREYIQLHSVGKLTNARKSELEFELKKQAELLKRLSKQEKTRSESTGLFDMFSEAKNKAQELKQLHKEFFAASQKTRKDELKKRIEKLNWELIETTLREQNKISALKQLEQYKKTNIKPFFLWKLNFAEIFERNGKSGFDVVIANPPYGANIDTLVDTYKKNYPNTTINYTEIYKIFFERSLRDLLGYNGILTFIVSNSFLVQPRYKDLRSFLIKHKVINVIRLGDGVFPEVVVPVCVIIVSREYDKNHNIQIADLTQANKYVGIRSEVIWNQIKQSDIENSRDRSFVAGVTLKQAEVYFDKVLDIRDAGIQYHRSGIGLKNKGGNDLYQRLFSDNPNQFKHSIPTWYGALIDRYYIKKKTDEYFNLDYKNILKQNEDVSFSKEAFGQEKKILWRQTAAELKAVLDDKEKRWFRNTIQCAWIRPEYTKEIDMRFVLGLVNSKFINYRYNELVKESGRIFPQIKIGKVKQLPFRLVPMDQQAAIIEIVNKILVITDSSDYLTNSEMRVRVQDYKKQIDQLFYKLYGLTSEEIAIIEGNELNKNE